MTFLAGCRLTSASDNSVFIDAIHPQASVGPSFEAVVLVALVIFIFPSDIARVDHPDDDRFPVGLSRGHVPETDGTARIHCMNTLALLALVHWRSVWWSASMLMVPEDIYRHIEGRT